MAGRDGEVGVEAAQTCGREAPREAPRPHRRGHPHRRRTPRVTEHLLDRPGVAIGVAAVDEQAGDAVVDDVEQPPTALATTGMPHAAASSATSPKLSLRLGTITTSAARYQLDRMWCGSGATKRTRSSTPSSTARRRDASSVAVDAARPTDDDEQRVAVGREPGEGADGEVGRLQRLQPADEEQHGTVRRQTDRPAGAVAVAGGEEGVLDGWRHDLDATGRIAVQAAELALLLGATHAHGVAAADHLGFGAVAPRRFEVAALGLHPGERVERRHERDVEGVLQPVADHAAQPVVAVHNVDTGAVAHVVEHTVGECVELVGERLLGQVVRPGRRRARRGDRARR